MSGFDRILAQRIAASEAHQNGTKAVTPHAALAFFTRAVLLSPDIPAFRSSFANTLSKLEPENLDYPGFARWLRRNGILRAMIIVLGGGGRAALTLEPFASAFVLSRRPLYSALLSASSAVPDRVDVMLQARSLHCGPGAAILRSLLSAVMVRDPALLQILEQIRQNLIRKICIDPNYLPAASAARLVDCLIGQIWIQDGVLTLPPDPNLFEVFDKIDQNAAAYHLARRLLYLVMAPRNLSYVYPASFSKKHGSSTQ